MNGEDYRLDAAVSVRKLVLQLIRESRVQGLERSLARSLSAVRRDLIHRPHDVGALWEDKTHNPTSSQLVYRSYYSAPVNVLYAIHEASKTVWLRDVRLLPALN